MKDYYNGKRLPEYYNTMHLDGYSADEVYTAFRKTMQKRVQESQEERELLNQIEERFEQTVSEALNEIFKNFNK